MWLMEVVRFRGLYTILLSFPVVLVVKNPPANAGNVTWVWLLGWEDPPEEYSCLESPMDRGAWWAMVYRITKSQTWLRQLSSQHTGDGVGQGGPSGRANDFLVVGRAFSEKQMTVWKDTWALRRIDGRYDSLVTVSVWVRERKIRAAVGEGIYDHWVLWGGSAFRQIRDFRNSDVSAQNKLIVVYCEPLQQYGDCLEMAENRET